MSQIYPLDYVIRRVDSDEFSLSSSQKIVIVDSKNKTVVRRKLFWQDVRYYLVSNTGDARNVAECQGQTTIVKDFGSNRSIGVCNYYQASCQHGDEDKVVIALFSDSHPGEVLNNLITQWILDYTRNKEAYFFDNYNTEQGKLQGRIAERARQEVGLDLKVRISLEGEEKLQAITLGPLFFAARVHDYERDLDLKISTTLKVDEENKIKALLLKWKISDFEKFIQEGTKAYLHKLSLQKFYNDLHNGALKIALVRELNKAINGLTGYQIEQYSIEHSTSAEPLPQEFFELEQDVECKVQEYPEPIIIKNKLQMILENIGQYKACRSPRLNSWCKETLERIIHESLFDAKYIDLLLDFHPKEEKIKSLMGEKAESIGYRINYLVTVPDIEHLKLKEKFTIETEAAFATKFSNVQVKLQIIIAARINDLKSVKKHLNRQENVIAIMRESILTETRQHLHTIDPEVFYMDFEHSRIEGESSIEKKLIALITDYLEKNFGAEVISVIPKVIDTELMARFRKLQGQLCPFEVEIESLRLGEMVKFKGNFQVEGVDKNGWHKFQIRESAIEEIRAYVEENVRGILGTQENLILKYNTVEHLKKLTDEIDSFAREKVSEAFGLVINVATFYRERTKKEKLISEVDERRDIEDLAELETSLHLLGEGRKTELEKDAIIKEAEKKQLEQLLEKRGNLLAMEDEEALEEVDKKIKTLKDERHSNSKQQIDKKLKQLKQQTANKTFDIGSFSKQLTTGSKKSDSESDKEKEKNDE